MPSQSQKSWIIAYDIRCKKRLARVYRYLSKQGLPIQYSIFLIEANQSQLGEIMLELANRIEASTDDIRIYHVTDTAQVWALGKQFDFGVVVFASKTLSAWVKVGCDNTQT